MSTFHNPYHFVPTGSSAVADIDATSFPEHITHDRYVSATHSGELVVELTTETPLLCGNKVEENNCWAKTIKAFHLKENPIIPGSQLRGAVSSIAEIASGSAFRVMENTSMSYRVMPKEQKGLTAMGMVVEAGGSYLLLPLTSPHYEYARLNGNNETTIADILQEGTPHPSGKYTNLFGKKWSPKISFGDIRERGFFNTYKTFKSPMDGPFYGLKSDITLSNHIKPIGRSQLLLGKKYCPNSQALKQNLKPWGEIPENEKQDYTRGILRIFGQEDLKDIRCRPGGKHEIFIPFEKDLQDVLENEGHRLVSITSQAVERFHQLADERSQAENDSHTNEKHKLPFGPLEAPRGNPDSNRPKGAWELKTGDLVFFSMDNEGDCVNEISLSSIWRGRVEDENNQNAGSHAFLEDKNFAPWNPDRKSLTPAEVLFGVVSGQKPEDTEPGKFLQALGGRVRFGPAMPNEGTQGDLWLKPESLWDGTQKAAAERLNKPVPLKNLASPKLPSPAMYFKKRKGNPGIVMSHEMTPGKHAIQGRKLYLRRNKENSNNSQHDEWVGGTNLFVHADRMENEKNTIINQHQCVDRFIAPENTFTFRIRFDNLTRNELDLLMYALSPSDNFRHQLGHGKPYGLGQVEMKPVKLSLVRDRKERYTKMGFSQSRYQDAQEQPELNKARTDHEAWAEGKNLQDVLKVLNVLGSPLQDGLPIHYPQVDGIHRGSPAFEEKTFKWFTENIGKNGKRHFLKPIDSQSVPPLDTVAKAPRATDHSNTNSRRNTQPGSTKRIGNRHPNANTASVGKQASNAQQSSVQGQLKAGDQLNGKFHPKGSSSNFGFVKFDSGEQGFLHKSHCLHKTLPQEGQEVSVKMIENPLPGKSGLICKQIKN